MGVGVDHRRPSLSSTRGRPRRLLPGDLRPRAGRRDALDPGLRRRAGAASRAGDGGARRQLRLRGGRGREHDGGEPRGLRPPPDRAADAPRRRRARPEHELLGTEMPAPLLLAPIGVQGIVHPDGELATARAAAALGVPMVPAPTPTSRSRRSPRPAARGRAGSSSTGPTTASLVESFVARAEAGGYEAIVLTVDTFIPGWKPRDLQQAWLPFLQRDGRSRTTSRTRSSARASRRRRRRTSAPPPATTSASRSTPR